MGKIKPFKGGSVSGRNKLNQIREELSTLSKMTGDGRYINVTRGPGGIMVSLNTAAVVSLFVKTVSQLRPVEITLHNNDTLTGRYLYPDSENPGELIAGDVDISVLKPWTLRRTPFDGLTVNGVSYAYAGADVRVATSGDDSETQYITQDYFIGAVIYVQETNEPGADVIDVNVDGRAWAKGDDQE